MKRTGTQRNKRKLESPPRRRRRRRSPWRSSSGRRLSSFLKRRCKTRRKRKPLLGEADPRLSEEDCLLPKEEHIFVFVFCRPFNLPGVIVLYLQVCESADEILAVNQITVAISRHRIYTTHTLRFPVVSKTVCIFFIVVIVSYYVHIVCSHGFRGFSRLFEYVSMVCSFVSWFVYCHLFIRPCII